MKSLFIILISLSSTFALANFERQIAGEVSAAQAMCPTDVMCMTNGTTIVIDFELSSGCSSLVPLEWKKNGNVIEVTATEAIASGVICTAATEWVSETISMSGVYPPFVVSFVGTEITTPVDNFF